VADRKEGGVDERQEGSSEAVVGVGLDEALEGLRAQLASAHVRAAGTDVQFPVESLTVELKVVVTRSAEGRAGFRVPVVGAELGGSGSRASETVQTVTLVLGGPVDRNGVPQRVARVSDEEKG
jgi:Trypsin-co-occurring domain 2